LDGALLASYRISRFVGVDSRNPITGEESTIQNTTNTVSNSQQTTHNPIPKATIQFKEDVLKEDQIISHKSNVNNQKKD
jgi:hypothetical protein